MYICFIQEYVHMVNWSLLLSRISYGIKCDTHPDNYIYIWSQMIHLCLQIVFQSIKNHLLLIWELFKWNLLIALLENMAGCTAVLYICSSGKFLWRESIASAPMQLFFITFTPLPRRSTENCEELLLQWDLLLLLCTLLIFRCTSLQRQKSTIQDSNV
jgi:hypothetical protein